MKIYDLEQWKKDKTFAAEPGQEIAEEVYTEFLKRQPPEPLPPGKARQALQDYNLPVHSGFIYPEPQRESRNGILYFAFGKNDFGKGPKYFYLGYSIKAEPLNGRYYYFDCMNACVEGLYKVSEFESIEEAIQTAACYEATLIEREFSEGELIRSKIIYEPY